MAGKSEREKIILALYTESGHLLLTHFPLLPPSHTQFVGGKGAAACIVEESEVDVATKTFTTYTRNINFNRLMSVEEKAVYTVSPDNTQWWVFSGRNFIPRLHPAED